MSLYVLRHGQTDDDVSAHDRPSGWTSIPLTKLGEQEAHGTGKFLAANVGGQKFIALFTSDLERARQTASIVAKHLNTQYFATPRLRALNWGALAGRPTDSIKAWIMHYKTHPNEVIPGGESYGASYLRFASVFPQFVKLADSHPDEHVGVVTHSLNIDMLPHIISQGRDPIKLFGDSAPPAGFIKIYRDSTGALKALSIVPNQGEPSA